MRPLSENEKNYATLILQKLTYAQMDISAAMSLAEHDRLDADVALVIIDLALADLGNGEIELIHRVV